MYNFNLAGYFNLFRWNIVVRVHLLLPQSFSSVSYTNYGQLNQPLVCRHRRARNKYESHKNKHDDDEECFGYIVDFYTKSADENRLSWMDAYDGALLNGRHRFAFEMISIRRKWGRTVEYVLTSYIPYSMKINFKWMCDVMMMFRSNLLLFLMLHCVSFSVERNGLGCLYIFATLNAHTNTKYRRTFKP